MYPWLPEGPLMTQWASAVIRRPLVSWAPSRQGGPRVTCGPLREHVAPSWAKSWVRAGHNETAIYGQGGRGTILIPYR